MFQPEKSYNSLHFPLASWRRSSHETSLGQDKLLLMSGCQACLNFKMIEVSTHTTSQTTLPTSCASGKLQFLCFIPSEVHQAWFNSRKRNAFHTKNPLKKISSRWRSIKDLNPRSFAKMKNPSHRVLELGVARGSAFWWAMDRMILSIFTGGSVFNVGKIEKL